MNPRSRSRSLNNHKTSFTPELRVLRYRIDTLRFSVDIVLKSKIYNRILETLVLREQQHVPNPPAIVESRLHHVQSTNCTLRSQSRMYNLQNTIYNRILETLLRREQQHVPNLPAIVESRLHYVQSPICTLRSAI